MVWHTTSGRAALLYHLKTPKKLRRAVSTKARVPGMVKSPWRQELDTRQLYPWIPPQSVFGSLEEEAPVLIVAGQVPKELGVAVVGARASDPYGLACARQVARDAVALGRSVISGGAEGCDAAAHRAALAAGGQTVVVLAGGHDHPYPSAHHQLFDEVLSCGGGVVSAYWPTIRPRKHQFLARNRVIALLSAVTVIVRARHRSGALTTARFARDLGRPVLAVPGNVGEGLSHGPHLMLRAGAQACVDAASLAWALDEPWTPSPWPVCHRGDPVPWDERPSEFRRDIHVEADGPEQSAVLDCLEKYGMLDLNALIVRTEFPVEVLVAVLSELEIVGAVHKRAGARYALR